MSKTLVFANIPINLIIARMCVNYVHTNAVHVVIQQVIVANVLILTEELIIVRSVAVIMAGLIMEIVFHSVKNVILDVVLVRNRLKIVLAVLD